MSLRVQDLEYTAVGQKSVRILQNVNLKVEAGRITLIVGRTGSGKSTLLNVLAGLKAPTQGQVYMEDAALWKKAVSNSSLLREIGLVFQYPEHQFFLPTVREELLYNLKPFRLKSSVKEKLISEICQSCGLGEELLKQSPFVLSGGEKRKVALASVLIEKPKWLLLDEPSAGLDSKAGAWLVQHLETLKAEKGNNGGIIIVSHDLDLFLPIADSVIMLKDGKVLGSWVPEELLEQTQMFDEAGVRVPACLQLASCLKDYSVQSEKLGRTLSLKAEDIADGFAASLCNGHPLKLSLPEKTEVLIQEPFNTNLKEIDQEQGDISRAVNPLTRLDPRSKWLVYVLFSVVVFMQVHWLGIGLSLLIAMIFAYYAKMPFKELRKPLLPMGIFILVTFLIAGLRLSITIQPFSMAGSSFVWNAAFKSLEGLAPLLPVIIGGVVFAYSTSPLSMKKGLEAVLKKIPGLGKGAEIIALTTSLMFRFLKLIPAEIERFSLLASTRGNKRGKVGKLKLRHLPAFMTPLLLSIMQYAEDISIAMEARGYGKITDKPTSATSLQWKRIDWVACLVGIGICGLLLAIKWLEG